MFIENPLLLSILLFFSFILGPVPILLWLFKAMDVIRRLESDVTKMQDEMLDTQRKLKELCDCEKW